MDDLTELAILKDDNQVVGLRIDPQGTFEDEYFCCMFPIELNGGRATIIVSNGEIIFSSLGIGGKEEFRFRIEENEGVQLREILFGLDRNYGGHVKLGGFGGYSLTIDFRKITPSLNKREQRKRRRSVWRSPTSPKNEEKIEEWERIYI